MKLEALEGSFSTLSKPILQVNTHLKALAETYTINTFAQISDLKTSIKNCQRKFAKIMLLFFCLKLKAHFGERTHFSSLSRLYRRRFCDKISVGKNLEICKFHILLVTLIFNVSQFFRQNVLSNVIFKINSSKIINISRTSAKLC